MTQNSLALISNLYLKHLDYNVRPYIWFLVQVQDMCTDQALTQLVKLISTTSGYNLEGPFRPSPVQDPKYAHLWVIGCREPSRKVTVNESRRTCSLDELQITLWNNEITELFGPF